MLRNCWRHFKVVCKHKKYVFRACKEMGIPMRGILHDLSKFSPIEFYSSAMYFQGNSSPIDAEKKAIGYSKAWMHHKGHNPHHWEYWVDWDSSGQVYACKIPLVYVKEMICDWVGAGKAYNSDKWEVTTPLNYYREKKHRMIFHPETQQFIEWCLKDLAENGEELFFAGMQYIDNY